MDRYDNVNHPKHYANGNIECIDAMKEMMTPEEFAGYCKGNAFKYLWRCKMKGKELEDLRKAQWYLDKLVSFKEYEKDIREGSAEESEILGFLENFGYSPTDVVSITSPEDIKPFMEIPLQTLLNEEAAGSSYFRYGLPYIDWRIAMSNGTVYRIGEYDQYGDGRQKYFLVPESMTDGLHVAADKDSFKAALEKSSCHISDIHGIDVEVKDAYLGKNAEVVWSLIGEESDE